MKPYNPSEYWDGNSIATWKNNHSICINNANIVGKMLIDRFKQGGIEISRTALLGMLGNMGHESGCSSGQWQNDRVGGEPKGQGFGLCQWTPYTKLTEGFLHPRGLPDDSLSGQIERIFLECTVASGDLAQWNTGKYGITFMQFITKTDFDLSTAVEMYCMAYEQPSVYAVDDRLEWANEMSSLTFDGTITINTIITPETEEPDDADNAGTERSENSLYELISKTSYNIGNLSAAQVKYLKSKTLTERVRVYQFCRAADIKNKYGGKPILQKRYYRIKKVNNKGWLVDARGTCINPRAVDI